MVAKRSWPIIILRWILGILSIAATVLLAAAGAFRQPLSYENLIGIGAVAVLAGIVAPGLETFSFEHRLVIEWRIVAHLRGAFYHLVSEYDFQPLELRLHYFQPRWRVQGSWPPATQKLVRVAFFSIKTSAGLSNIEWPKGVGLVGKVWKDNDIHGLAEDVRVQLPKSRAAWDRLARDVRHGMSWKEVRQVADTEAAFAVVARAHQFSGEAVGVLSADTTATELPKFTDRVHNYLRQMALSASDAAARR